MKAWTILDLILILYLLGLVSSVGGDLIHLLLGLAIVVVIAHLAKARPLA
jgi:hypothetical protein